MVYPADNGDVVRVVRFAAQNGLTVHPRGAGSGLCGSALGRGIVIDFSRFMNRLIDLDVPGGYFVCEPGYRLGELEKKLDGTGLFFPPDPSSGEYATFGGMFGTNASGAHSVKYGNVADYVLDAEVVWSDGTVSQLSRSLETPISELPDSFRKLAGLYRDHRQNIETAYPNILCNTAGYNLRGLVTGDRLDIRRLLAGSEGTLGVVTQLCFRLIQRPAHDSLVVAFFEDLIRAGRAVQELLPMNPAGIEIMDQSLLRLAREHSPELRQEIPGDIAAVLLIEYDGQSLKQVQDLAERAREIIRRDDLASRSFVAVTAAQKDRLWAVRKAAVPILYRLKGRRKILALIEDAAVPTDRLLPYFEGLVELMDRRKIPFVIYGHIAKGLLHTRPLLDLKDPSDVAEMKILADGVCDLVHSLNGTVSGEHGDGRLRSAYLKRQYPTLYPLFGRVKALLDPNGILNPDIITRHDPAQMTRFLRYGTEYRSRDPGQHVLRWDDGYVEEIEKCHGCSKCTTVTEATRMCPVYKFTREEESTPKAKANLLRALVSGVWDSREAYGSIFQSVMKRCIQCGSCSKECPSEVNIPKLVLETRAAYVRRFGAPLPDRVITRVEEAARAARYFPKAADAILSAPLVRRAQDLLLGISCLRRPVTFVSRPLSKRIKAVEGKGGQGSILFFPGCFAGTVRPEIGESCIRVLSRMGFAVYTPDTVCCGLPMLSKGMIDDARKKIRRNLDIWGQLVSGVDFIVSTCSSCGLSLTREWADALLDPLIPAIRLKTLSVSQLVHRYAGRLNGEILPKCSRSGFARSAYHAPCHLKIQSDPDASVRMLSDIAGMDLLKLNSHCCGMAGTWGAMTDHVELSFRIGSDLAERVRASGASRIVTDCPTCTLQLEQVTGLPVDHPMQVMDGLFSGK